MVRHYTQLEIINLSKLPPTTVKRWLEYFSYFVPGPGKEIRCSIPMKL